MRLILNIIWLVFAGLWTALGYALAALIVCHRHHLAPLLQLQRGA